LSFPVGIAGTPQRFPTDHPVSKGETPMSNLSAERPSWTCAVCDQNDITFGICQHWDTCRGPWPVDQDATAWDTPDADEPPALVGAILVPPLPALDGTASLALPVEAG